MTSSREGLWPEGLVLNRHVSRDALQCHCDSIGGHLTRTVLGPSDSISSVSSRVQ